MPSKAPYVRGFHPAVGPCLLPVTDEGRDQIAALQADKQVMVHIHAPRNVRHHRMLFTLLNRIVEGGAWDGTPDTLLTWLKIRTGHIDTHIDAATGQAYFIPKSIAFESMAQDVFSRWFDRAVFLIAQHLLDGADWEALRDEIVTIVDGDQGRQAKEIAARYGT